MQAHLEFVDSELVDLEWVNPVWRGLAPVYSVYSEYWKPDQ